MKPVLKKIVLVVLLVPVALVVVSLFLPSRYRVERSVVVRAQPAAIYPWLAQFPRWPQWAPWTTNRDPSLVYSYSGATEGKGAIQSWTSTKDGPGTMTLTAADPQSGVEFELNFNQGQWISRGAIRMQAESEGTRVTWHNQGDLGWNPVARYFGLLFDGMMGKDFETGLSNLQTRVEGGVK
jgi:hypothetical protein